MTDSKHKLHLAVVQGDLKNVEDLLEQFVLASPAKALQKNVKRPKLEYLTYKSQFDLLTEAVNNNHPHIVKLLIEKGFRKSHDRLQSTSATLLHIAVQAANLEIVKLLLQFGADANAVDRRDCTTVLFQAVNTQKIDIVKVLLEHGASANHWIVQGSPLRRAIELKNLQIIEVLHNYGADFSKAIEEAIKTRNMEIFEVVLLKSAGLPIVTPAGSDLFCFAARHGSVEMMVYFLNRGMSVESKDQRQVPVLIHAVEAQREDIVELLLKHGADGNVCGLPSRYSRDGGLSALHIAATIGNAAIARSLLNHGANINYKCRVYWYNGDTETPLHYACQKGFFEVVRVLVQHGAFAADLQMYTGRSIQFAAKNGHTEIFKLLLEQENVDNSLHYVTNALRDAVRKGSHEIIKFLLARGLSVGDSLHTAVYFKSGDCTTVKILLDSGANVNSLDNSNETPLHVAVKHADSSIVKMLLDAGANINIKGGHNGKPTIHYAVHRNSFETFKEKINILLNHGANLNETDNKGCTILHCVYAASEFQYLLERGADFNVVNMNGNTFINSRNAKGTEKLLIILFQMSHYRGVPIGENVLRDIKKNSKLYTFYSQCKDELEDMKEEMIDGTDTSLFDIFTTFQYNQLLACVRNDKVFEYFDAKRYRNKFSVLEKFIVEHVEQVLFRRQLLDDVKLFFRILFDDNGKKLPPLPISCADRIFSYLNDSDLISLSKNGRYSKRTWTVIL